MIIPKRIEGQINKTGPNGCWLWTGHITKSGYGLVWFKGKTRLVHRVIYQHLVGEIPDDLELDHLCRIRSCVNPVHLEAVTGKVNCQRGNTGILNRQKTHCKNGHPLSGDNVYMHGTWRRCRTCRHGWRKKGKQQ